MSCASIFRRDKSLIAMIHVGALPGTPFAADSVERLAARAADEARLYAAHGVDALLLENMHDRPYLNREVGPEIVAGMTAVAAAVRAAVPPEIPCGVQILAGANVEALAVAHLAGLQFIRAEGFVFAHVADEGLMPRADAGPLLRYRRQLGAGAIRIYADVKKKHSAHAITADVDLAETARAAGFFAADGVVVTGTATGEPTCPSNLRLVREAVDIPVLVGSGVTPENLPGLWPHADAFIIGSYLKRDGCWSNEPEPRRVDQMVSAFQALRAGR